MASYTTTRTVGRAETGVTTAWAGSAFDPVSPSGQTYSPEEAVFAPAPPTGQIPSTRTLSLAPTDTTGTSLAGGSLSPVEPAKVTFSPVLPERATVTPATWGGSHPFSDGQAPAPDSAAGGSLSPVEPGKVAFDPSDALPRSEFSTTARTSVRSLSKEQVWSPTTHLAGWSVDAVVPERQPFNPTDSLGMAAIIPTSYFRKATGRVMDADTGEPITNGIYLIALDNFAVAGPVDAEGYFTVYLLRQTYTSFILTADASINDGDNGEYDYVWYEAEGNPEIGVNDDHVVLEFSTDVPEMGPPPAIGGGLIMGEGVNFG